MKKYLLIWVLASGLLGFEYFALNFAPQLSLLGYLQKNGVLTLKFQVTSTPGRSLSLWLGWMGLSFMIIMNLYSMRKRFSVMQKWGRLSNWLDFHIFCGLLGPTFIFFHCNFKVRGIVGISFWSMVISFLSGIIGKYFYVQMLKEKTSLELEAEKREAQLNKVLEKNKIPVTPESLQQYKLLALQYVGLPQGEASSLNPLSALLSAAVGDLRMMFKGPKILPGWPASVEYILGQYALSKRKALFLRPFQRLMGYWHSFHFPFAIFMYLVAVIHVAAALILGV